jgi:hypothetical protein
MSPGQVQAGSLRPDQFDHSRLAWAFGISLALHLTCFGAYELGKRLQLWQWLHLPDWLARPRVFSVVPEQPEPQPDPVPMMFVDVNPRLAAAEPPKQAKYYSDRNSEAANPEADRDANVPKIDGTQTEIPKAEDTPRLPYEKLPPVAPARAVPESARPPVGDLAMVRPDTRLHPAEGTAGESRPRTVTEARMRESRNQLVGEKMKQEGGVKRRRVDPGFDVLATPFGAYDAAFVRAVEQRWFDLLDNISFDGYRRGKVMLQFRLHDDGRVTDMQLLDENVGQTLSLLCQKAVLDPAPYERWPSEMRQMVERDYREFHFAFYY